jgi:hypothetical protein
MLLGERFLPQVFQTRVENQNAENSSTEELFDTATHSSIPALGTKNGERLQAAGMLSSPNL